MKDRIDGFLAEHDYFTDDDRKRIGEAWAYLLTESGELRRAGGEPFAAHPLRVAAILATLHLDADAIIAALFHGAPDKTSFSETELEARFGKTVSKLVRDTSRISLVKLQNSTIHQAEAIRKMFFAMVDDIRVMLIRLADRLDKMRTLKLYPGDEQKIIAQETIDIWAPLANRLGISFIKDELEDLSLKYLNRDVFDYIKNLVAAKKGERSEFLENAEGEIRAAASKSGFTIEVKSRAKHFWSIYKKMKKRNKGADEIMDLLAMRILCPTVTDCYTILGLVHTIWKPLDGRFKDYIAMPKPNGYQSLHTTVLCLEGRPLEIQIRTFDMHHVAENGIASHWLYKKGTGNELVRADHLSIINQLRELSKGQFTDDELLSQIKNDLLGDSIYVFTPKGDIVELPAGSTAIDFAYNIHTAVGEKIVGAKADGSIIPLSQALRNTQVVEVITHPQAHPTLNQYNNVRTAKARQKIRAWLIENDPNSGFERKDEDAAAPIHGQTHGQAHRHPQSHAQSHSLPPGGYLPEETGTGTEREFDAAVLKIRVGDTTNFLLKFANCCRPVPPDPITGYVSRGRGIIIHKTGCLNLARIPEIEHRGIQVEWEVPPAKDDRAKKPKKDKA